FVSLTLTPMLCARVLKEHDPNKRLNIVLRSFEAAFNWGHRVYERGLDWVLAYKSVMLIVTIATLIGTVVLYAVVPKGFFPDEDTGFIVAITEAATDTSFDAMVERHKQLGAIVAKDPAVEYYNSTVGAGGPNPTGNYGNMFIVLKPRAQR